MQELVRDHLEITPLVGPGEKYKSYVTNVVFLEPFQVID